MAGPPGRAGGGAGETGPTNYDLYVHQDLLDALFFYDVFMSYGSQQLALHSSARCGLFVEGVVAVCASFRLIPVGISRWEIHPCGESHTGGDASSQNSSLWGISSQWGGLITVENLQ